MPRLTWGHAAGPVRESLEQALVSNWWELFTKFASFRDLDAFPSGGRGLLGNPSQSQSHAGAFPPRSATPPSGSPGGQALSAPGRRLSRIQLRAPRAPCTRFSKSLHRVSLKEKKKKIKRIVFKKTRLKAVLVHKSLCAMSIPLACTKNPLEALSYGVFLK